MVRLRFSSQGAGTPASTARRGGKESHRVENAPKREKRGGRVVVLCNRRRWSWEPFDPLSLSLFLFFSFEKKTASPAAPRSRRKCARFAPPPQQAREFGPCCTKGTRRDATGGARSGEKAGSMVEAPRPKSYLNAPPSLCLLELFFPFFALFHPAKRRKKLESSLFISPAAGPRKGGGAASLAGRGVECVRALSYIPREARTAKDMATKRGAEEWVRKRVIRGVTRGRRRRRGKKKLIFFAFRGAPVSRASLTELSSRRLHHHHRPTAAPAPRPPKGQRRQHQCFQIQKTSLLLLLLFYCSFSSSFYPERRRAILLLSSQTAGAGAPRARAPRGPRRASPTSSGRRGEKKKKKGEKRERDEKEEERRSGRAFLRGRKRRPGCAPRRGRTCCSRGGRVRSPLPLRCCRRRGQTSDASDTRTSPCWRAR